MQHQKGKVGKAGRQQKTWTAKDEQKGREGKEKGMEIIDDWMIDDDLMESESGSGLFGGIRIVQKQHKGKQSKAKQIKAVKRTN